MTDEYEVELKPVDMDAPVESAAKRRGLTREEAIDEAKRAAQLEGEVLQLRRPDVYTDAEIAERVERAGEYAGWEYDGRQAGSIGRVGR